MPRGRGKKHLSQLCHSLSRHVGSSLLRNIFCEAFKKNMYGRKFQWLIVGIYPQDWWLEGDQICPLEQLQRALVGTIVMEMTPLSTSEEPTVLNLVSRGHCSSLGSHESVVQSFSCVPHFARCALKTPPNLSDCARIHGEVRESNRHQVVVPRLRLRRDLRSGQGAARSR